MNLKYLAEMAMALLIEAILLPMGMAIVVGTVTTTWNTAVVTLWNVLVPVLVMIGTALLFIPSIRGD